MPFITETQGIINISVADDYLENWLQSFLIDRKAAGVASGTLHLYRTELKLFSGYCEAQTVTQISQITSTFLRQHLLYLEEAGHNPGGRHAAYRAIRTFLFWYEEEVELEVWSNPIRKVKAPKVPIEPIEPVSIETVAKMIKICKKGTFTGDRDTAILLCLLDTGARANEFLDINNEPVVPLQTQFASPRAGSSWWRAVLDIFKCPITAASTMS